MWCEGSSMKPDNLLLFQHAPYIYSLSLYNLFFLSTYWLLNSKGQTTGTGCWLLSMQTTEIRNSSHHKAVMWEGAIDASDLQCKILLCPVYHLTSFFSTFLIGTAWQSPVSAQKEMDHWAFNRVVGQGSNLRSHAVIMGRMISSGAASLERSF